MMFPQPVDVVLVVIVVVARREIKETFFHFNLNNALKIMLFLADILNLKSNLNLKGI
jgi:hypothetical protein